MLGLAERAGHTLTPDAADADVLVVNTCAFIESARQESIDAILEMAAHKTGGRCRRLVVTGCMAERYRDELRKEIPEIDAVLGTSEVPGIVGAEAPGAAGAPDPYAAPRRASAGRRCPIYLYDDLTPRTLTTPSHYAYVKIAEGCNYKCAFCIIPRLRGRYRSRTAASIVREARALALARRQGTAARLAGHHLLRQRPGRAGRARAACCVSSTRWTASSGSGCSTSTRRRSRPTRSAPSPNATRCASTSTCRCSTPRTPVLRRMRRPGTRAELRPARARRSGRPFPASRCAPRSSSGSPARRTANSRTLRQFVREMRVRPRRRVHLLARGGHVGGPH